MSEGIVEDTAASPDGSVAVSSEEKTALDDLCDEIAALKARVAQLESVAHAGHELNENAVRHIASVVMNHLNDGIRRRLHATTKAKEE